MDFDDWVYAAISVVFGIFLGSMVDSLVQMSTTDLPFALFMTFLFAALFFFMWISIKPLDWLFDWLTSRFTQSSRNLEDKQRKPIPLLVSLPAGFVLGVALARLELDEAVLGLVL